MAGFVKDATDAIATSNAATTLLASGGTATKVWQSTEVIVGKLPDLYYTSTDPKSQRWSSPGSFVISMVGQASSSGELQVFVHWDVTLTEPTYEGSKEEDTDGFVSCKTAMYTSASNKYLSKRNGSDWTPVVYGDFSPPLKAGDIVELGHFKFCSVMNTSSTLSGMYGFQKLKASSGTVYPVDERSLVSSENFFDEVYVLAEGEKGLLRRTENLLRASWYLSPSPRSLPSPITRSWFLQGAHNQLVGVASDPSTSCCQDCMEKLHQDCMPPTSEKFESSLPPLRDTSVTLPGSKEVPLSTVLDSLMDSLSLLRGRSTTAHSLENADDGESLSAFEMA